jgi:hypothetical protein
LGQKRDHSVVAVILKKNGQITLVHLKRFPLGTEYQAVIEYLKLVGERFRNVRTYYIDQTGVGEAFPENARRAGVKNGALATTEVRRDDAPETGDGTEAIAHTER